MTTATRDSLRRTIDDGLVELGVERDELKTEATLEDLDVDSLDLVELAQIVEDEHGIEISNQTPGFKEMATLGDLVDVVAKAGGIS